MDRKAMERQWARQGVAHANHIARWGYAMRSSKGREVTAPPDKETARRVRDRLRIARYILDGGQVLR